MEDHRAATKAQQKNRRNVFAHLRLIQRRTESREERDSPNRGHAT